MTQLNQLQYHSRPFSLTTDFDGGSKYTPSTYTFTVFDELAKRVAYLYSGHMSFDEATSEFRQIKDRFIFDYEQKLEVSKALFRRS